MSLDTQHTWPICALDPSAGENDASNLMSCHLYKKEQSSQVPVVGSREAGLGADKYLATSVDFLSADRHTNGRTRGTHMAPASLCSSLLLDCDSCRAATAAAGHKNGLK